MSSTYIDPLGVPDLTLEGMYEPFTEVCEGCDGTGHLGHRVPSRIGPCECCLGTGRVVFGWTPDRKYAVMAPQYMAVSFLMTRSRYV